MDIFSLAMGFLLGMSVTVTVIAIYILTRSKFKKEFPHRDKL